jgi:putative heme-binding domain-containing protein
VVEERGGNVENGHKTFTTSCSVCHAFKGEGRDLAPNLTGMGAHGPADLLIHILDPNRQVEPNFYTTTIELKDDTSYDGIIARENSVEVVLRNASGDFTLRKTDITRRRQGNLSLMPEGFESLGPQTMRDLLAYLCADEQKYRILDLAPAFTANNAKGVYMSRDQVEDAPFFRRHGLVKVGEVPFDVLHPQKATVNLVVLRGGEGIAKTMPQRVEFPAHLVASRLHFLSGIAGWGWPSGGDSQKGIPALKVTLHFAAGGTEEMVFHNGIEFADWIGDYEVPGSKPAPDLARRGQIRVFSREVKRHALIDHISLESFDNRIAPTVVAITAELASPDDKPANTGESSATSTTTGTGPRILIVGAGSSHDFQKWFLEADSQTLAIAGAKVQTSSDPNELDKFLDSLDVLYLSNNAPFTNQSTRQAILNFASTGKGVLLVHPALWYNWNDWPEYNRTLCGGGSRGHDRYAPFQVTVTDPGHPLMRGVPSQFTVSDELYWFEPDTTGTPIKILATAHSPSKNRDFPMVFVVEHPKARIVGIALGHDGSAHESAAYRTLLVNALKWAAQK